MQSLRLIVCLLVLSSLVLVLAQAPPPLTPQMSPIVTWDAERDISRPPTKRPLTAAELKTARTRADRFYDLVKATPSFSQPAKHVTLVTAWPVVLDDGALSERFYAYRSAPAASASARQGSSRSPEGLTGTRSSAPRQLAQIWSPGTAICLGIARVPTNSRCRTNRAVVPDVVDIINSLAGFPNVKYDDDVDAWSQCMNWLRSRTTTPARTWSSFKTRRK